jgi:hypothetical protein
MYAERKRGRERKKLFQKLAEINGRNIDRQTDQETKETTKKS